MTILKSFEKPLTPEEELKYLTKFKEEQDEHAKEVLIERNMRLVAHIAKKYNTTEEEIAQTNEINLEDDLQPGKCLILEKKVAQTE